MFQAAAVEFSPKDHSSAENKSEKRSHDHYGKNLRISGKTPHCKKHLHIPCSRAAHQEGQKQKHAAGNAPDKAIDQPLSSSQYEAHKQKNHRPATKADAAVAPGDVISARGFGKCEVAEVGGLSKKGRTGILLRRYL